MLERNKGVGDCSDVLLEVLNFFPCSGFVVVVTLGGSGGEDHGSEVVHEDNTSVEMTCQAIIPVLLV